ncbi:MAG: AraC family transcriptional regulator [Burkholderiaceae bacterium]
MDLLSNLLSLTPVTGHLDVRCHFGSPWRIDQPVSGLQEIQYHVLLQGAATVESEGGNLLRLSAGDIVLFPSGDAHVLRDGGGQPSVKVSTHSRSGIAVSSNRSADAGETVDILCGRFLIPHLSHLLLRDYLPPLLHVRSLGLELNRDKSLEARVAGTRLARLIELMREEALGQEPGSESLINHLSGALFGLALRYASQSGEPPRGLLMLAQRPRMQPALSAIFERPGEPWTLPRLAELCSMSRATFVRHFDGAVGRSAIDFLTDVRMAVAGRMLVESMLSIAQIGESVGYQSPAAFQRAFKKQVGITPAQWRSRAKGR